jgi:hypothetical protein
LSERGRAGQELRRKSQREDEADLVHS